MGSHFLKGPADFTGMTRALFLSGLLDSARGRTDAAQASLQEALRLSRENRNALQEGEVLHQLGMVASQRRDAVEAESLLRQSIEVRTAMGRRDESGMSLVFLAAVAMSQGDMSTARESIQEALQIGLSLRDRRSAWSLDMLACISAADGSAERALRLAGARRRDVRIHRPEAPRFVARIHIGLPGCGPEEAAGRPDASGVGCGPRTWLRRGDDLRARGLQLLIGPNRPSSAA